MKTPRFEDKHNFTQSECGGNGIESWSQQKCIFCGKAFTHYYQKESYSDAMKKARIKPDDKCYPPYAVRTMQRDLDKLQLEINVLQEQGGTK